jgi:hypothetical protein
MHLYFSGAEVPTHLQVLRSVGVERIAVNVANLTRFAGDLAKWATRDRLAGLEWILYADSDSVPVAVALEVIKNAEVAPECIIGPIEWYEQTWLSQSDLLFLPTWHGDDPGTLRYYTETFDGVALPDSVVDNPTAVRQARAAQTKFGQIAALTGRSKGLERFDLLATSAWWAVQKYGETQVWTGDRLTRLNSEDKALKRDKYAPSVEALGGDVAKFLADDPTESVRIAVLSWMHLEAHLAAGRASYGPTDPSDGPPVVTRHPSAGGGNVVPLAPAVARAAAQPRHHLLPVMGLSNSTTTDDDGNEEVQSTIQVPAQSMRQCNTCSLSLACPSYQPASQCSYQIPVVIRSKQQLQATLRALVEIQTQRILMGHFAEEINGQPDVLLGNEMDRLFKMVESWRRIEDNRDKLRVTVEAQGGDAASMGVLSRLFGEKVGQNALLLEEPLDTEAVIDHVDPGLNGDQP